MDSILLYYQFIFILAVPIEENTTPRDILQVSFNDIYVPDILECLEIKQNKLLCLL